MPELRQERSIGDLFGQLSQDMTLLVRQEVQLARAEMSDKLSRLTKNLISVGAGGFVAYIGSRQHLVSVVLTDRGRHPGHRGLRHVAARDEGAEGGRTRTAANCRQHQR
jgi:putative superfamily III holin-X